MPMPKCKECGHEVSSTAEACPNCGAKISHYPVKKALNIIYWVAAILGGCWHRGMYFHDRWRTEYTAADKQIIPAELNARLLECSVRQWSISS